MPLRDLLKKKDKQPAGEKPAAEALSDLPTPVDLPIFTFMRSDTNTQEIISPPTYSSADSVNSESTHDTQRGSRTSRFLKGRTHSSSSAVSRGSVSSNASDASKPKSPKMKRLSQRLHLRRSEASSSSVPTDLPEIHPEDEGDDGAVAESQWEKRATLLAKTNEEQRSRPSTPVGPPPNGLESSLGGMALADSAGKGIGVISTKQADDNIQEAIRLHEAGDLETSTRMFGRLADPNGENNALSQVLYGLALRHGWGCNPSPTEAVTYLSFAAVKAASIEELALQAGMKKGGAAKGELVLAIFELGNCFRHGWGVQVDKFAAKQYYETAANLGDTDAMNEVAWCFAEGFGCKKDRFAAAKYYRLAESSGSKTLGNSWIWKEKYNDPPSPKKGKKK